MNADMELPDYMGNQFSFIIFPKTISCRKILKEQSLSTTFEPLPFIRYFICYFSLFGGNTSPILNIADHVFYFDEHYSIMLV